MANISQITIPNGTTYDIKDTVAREHSIEYIRGTWTAASGTWTGVTTDPELYDGKQIILYMPFAGSGNATLNLTLATGETTGPKDVYFENTTRFTTHKGQNSHLHLIYHKAMTLSNGNTYEGWWYMMNRDTNDYYGVHNINGTYKTKTALYRYQILLTIDEEYLLPINAVNNSTATNKTLTTEAFDPFGQIFYYNSTNTYSAGAKLASWNQMWLFSGNSLVDLRYSFNTGTTLTANKAVYLVCTPQSNGLAKLHSAPIAQDLPTSDNGLIYIYLGQAYDNYRITWALNKTVYWYKDGCVREYTNGAAYAVSAGDAATVSGHTVAKNVPSDAKFTDTTALGSMTGTLSAAHGGTGATTLASGEALIGNGTGAVTTRAIRNNTSNGSIGWTSSSASTSLLTQNDVAYWNGRYNDTASNLQYTKVGELKAAATYEVETTVANDAKLPTGAAVQAYVTGLGYTKNTGTVTKVTAGTGLTGGDITTTGTIALGESGVTAGSAGPTAAVTGNDGTTVAIPRITVDKYGRVTALTSYNLTNKNTTYTIANNLTTTVAGSALDATQGKALSDKFGSYLPLAGGTVTGTLILSRTTDLSGTANNKPALIVGGTDTQTHIEIDKDEIHAKASGTAVSPLYLNWDGGAVINGVGGLQTKGSIRVGITADNTGGCTMQYASATNSLNFNFS